MLHIRLAALLLAAFSSVTNSFLSTQSHLPCPRTPNATYPSNQLCSKCAQSALVPCLLSQTLQDLGCIRVGSRKSSFNDFHPGQGCRYSIQEAENRGEHVGTASSEVRRDDVHEAFHQRFGVLGRLGVYRDFDVVHETEQMAAPTRHRANRRPGTDVNQHAHEGGSAD
ncbi:hypothetical protein DFH09DRAFT_1111228 [Mycena vulgaris]|nr:hypothetical protein DFH09DRAFT_1111228 [Mycena vulgaris]